MHRIVARNSDARTSGPQAPTGEGIGQAAPPRAHEPAPTLQSDVPIRVMALLGVPLGIVAVAAYGCWQGTPQDVVAAVRAGDVEAVKRAIARDPAAVHTKVYAQAFERQESRLRYRNRTGLDPWEGKYIIHDAVAQIADPLPMLDALAEGGADLAVRLNGRTLLHLAAQDGNLEVATWLLNHGADPNAVNDCPAPCVERGQTPLHEGLAFKDDEMTVLLLDRGASVSAAAANGRTALHDAGERGRLSGAFVLCRYGADPASMDADGRTPHDLALASMPAPRSEGAEQVVQWLRPGGGCAMVAASARMTKAPVSEAEARKVFGQTVDQ